jgi:hypothetical protein
MGVAEFSRFIKNVVAHTHAFVKSVISENVSAADSDKGKCADYLLH